MKRVGSVVSLLALTLCMAGCDKSSFEAKSTVQLHKENGVPVRIQKINPEIMEFSFPYNSVLTGSKESVASSMVSDRVDGVHHQVGDFVKKDAIVISFPDDNPSAQYHQAKVAYEHAKTTLDRMQNLYNTGGISRQSLDDVVTQCEVSKANFDAVRQAINVKAPISGTITQINVRPTDNVDPGDRLFTISNTKKLKTRLWITESSIKYVKKDALTTASWGNTTLTGKVTQVDMSLNTDKQAFGVIIEFENDGSVPSGVNADVVIHYRDESPSIFIDRKNLIKEMDRYYVYVAENNKAKKKEVTTGRNHDVYVEIVDGLALGDKLLTESLMLLEDDTLIRIVD